VAVTITIGEDGNVIFAKAKSGPEPCTERQKRPAYKRASSQRRKMEAGQGRSRYLLQLLADKK